MKLPISEVEAANLARALHAAMNTVIQEAGTGFNINDLYKAPPQPGAKFLDENVDVVALAAATSRIKATAELVGVDAQTLVSLAKGPKEAAHRHKLLARIAQFMGRMPSLLYPQADDDSKTDDGDPDDNARENDQPETYEAETDSDDDETDNDFRESEAALGSSEKRNDELERLRAAVKESIETACWAHEETEIAAGELEKSFRALIKAKDARGDD